ncbi:MAG: MFS transporter [Chloroflexota bacterium]
MMTQTDGWWVAIDSAMGLRRSPHAASESTFEADDNVFTKRMSIPPTIFAVYLPTALLAFSQGLLIATLPLYAQSFGVGYKAISVAVGAAAIGTLVMDVPAGALLGRIGLRPAMIGGSALVAVSTLALAFTKDFNLVVVMRVLAGIGTAMWGLSRHAYIAEAIPVGQRGKALSTFGGINRIGLFVGPVLGGVIADLLGLRWSFVAGAILAGFALAISITMLRPVPRVPGPAHRERWSLVKQAMRRNWQDLSAAFVALTMAQMIRAGRYLLIPLYGADTLHLNAADIGLIMTIGALTDVAMFVPAGIVMDRFGRKVASVPSFTVMAIGVAMIPSTHSFLGLAAASVVIGLGNGLGSGAMMTLGADLAPNGATGEFLGVWRLIGDVGATLGPLTVGWVAASIGLSGSAYALALMGVGAALTIAFLVKETRLVGESQT